MAEADAAQAAQDLLDRQISDICEKLNNLRKREKEIMILQERKLILLKEMYLAEEFDLKSGT